MGQPDVYRTVSDPSVTVRDPTGWDGTRMEYVFGAAPSKWMSGIAALVSSVYATR